MATALEDTPGPYLVVVDLRGPRPSDDLLRLGLSSGVSNGTVANGLLSRHNLDVLCTDPGVVRIELEAPRRFKPEAAFIPADPLLAACQSVMDGEGRIELMRNPNGPYDATVTFRNAVSPDALAAMALAGDQYAAHGLITRATLEALCRSGNTNSITLHGPTQFNQPTSAE